MRTNGVLTWVLSDHLGSASVTASENGSFLSERRYTAFGEVRLSSGETGTPYQYTGQLSQMDEIGLYYYVARWYDPVTAHFSQADTIVPESQGVLGWDRYSYVNYNPLSYNDPNGHFAFLATAAIGAAIAATVDYGFQVYQNVQCGQTLNQAIVNVDLAEISGAAVAGGFAGLTLGAGTAILTAVAGSTAATGLMAVPVAAIAGGVGNSIGGQFGALTEAGVRQIGNSQFDKDRFFDNAFQAGFLNSDDFMWDLGTGAILGATGQAFSNLTAPSSAAKYRLYNQFRDIEGNIVKVPQGHPVRLPGEVAKPVIKGISSGLMRRISDLAQEIISQGINNYRHPQQCAIAY